MIEIAWLLRCLCQRIECFSRTFNVMFQSVLRRAIVIHQGCGIYGSGISTMAALNFWRRRRWWEVCNVSTSPINFVKDVYSGSNPKKAFWRSHHQEQQVLVHTGVCRPIKPNSFGKSIYFLLFIDDFSKKKKKLGIFFVGEIISVQKFQEVQSQLIEKESGLVIKAMGSDRGGEFTSNEFQKYCQDNGICRPLTVSRYP